MRGATVLRARDSCQDVPAPNSQLGEHYHGDEEAVVSRYSAVGWAAPEIGRSEDGRPKVGREKERAQEIRRTEIGSAQVVPSQIIRTGFCPEVISA